MQELISKYGSDFLIRMTPLWIAILTPGPDLIMVIRNSIAYNRLTGVLTALGLAAGIFTHLLYSAFGLGLLIKESTSLLYIIKFAGGGYLIYLGVQSLRTKRITDKEFEAQISVNKKGKLPLPSLKKGKAFQNGFLTDLLNPFAAIFLISLMTGIPADTPIVMRGIYVVGGGVAGFIEYGLVALIFTMPLIRHRFVSIQHWISRIGGIALILVALKQISTAL